MHLSLLPLPLRALSFLLIVGGGSFALAALPTPDPDNGGLTLPPGFRALVVVDDLLAGRKIDNSNDYARFITAAPNGDLYVKTLRGGIFALRDTDGDGRFDQRQEFGSGGGTGIALQADWLYHSSNSAVYRYKYTPGELVPAGEPQTIVTGLPDKRTHAAKAFAFDAEGRLYVEVGSPTNAYSEGDRALGAKGKDASEHFKTFGGFWRFDAHKLNQKQADGFHFSTGHRHTLAITWQPTAQAFFMVQMGRDQLNTVAPDYYNARDNAENVAEELHLLREGLNPGWPYTYYDPIKKARMVAPEFGGDNQKRAAPGQYPDPLIAFPAHWAPLQMTTYSATQFPAHYRGGLFIAFHGSWNRAPEPQEGFNISFVPVDAQGMPSGGYEVFASGFPGKTVLSNVRDATYRPGGVAVGPDGSLYVSDTRKGRIWRIFHDGSAMSPAAPSPATKPASTPTPATAPTAATTSAPAPATAAAPAPTQPAASITPASAKIIAEGKVLYDQLCATCHMADGQGAANLQPSLVDNAVVKGDPAQLIRVILQGPAAALPANRPKYGNIMPPYDFLPDDQIAAVLTYLRQDFGHQASPISAAQVAAARAP